MAFTAKTRQQLVHATIRELRDWGRPDSLAADISSTGTLSLTATDYTLYTKYTVFEIDQEIFLGPSANATSTAITATKRGHQGTTASTHTSGAIIRFNPKYEQQLIVDLINTCLEVELQKFAIDDTNTLSADGTYLYDLPTGVNSKNLKKVFVRSSSTDATARTEEEVHYYRIREGQGTGGVDQIEFKYAPALSRYIEFQYSSGFSRLETDGASCDLPLNEAAQRLPILYVCSQLLTIRDNQRLRKDKYSYPKGSTPMAARPLGASHYWETFKRIRKQQRLTPKQNSPITYGW